MIVTGVKDQAMSEKIKIVSRSYDGRTHTEFYDRGSVLSINSWGALEVDISEVRRCFELEDFYITGDFAEIDLSPLSECHALQKIIIEGKGLLALDFTPLSSLENLELIGIYQATDRLSVIFDRMPSVTKLDIRGSFRVFDLGILRKLPSLQELSVYGDFETFDIPNLEDNQTIRRFSVHSNRLTSFNWCILQKFHGLEVLYVGEELKDCDLRPLNNDSSIRNVVIEGKFGKADLSPLGAASNLNLLVLESTRLDEIDLTPLGLSRNLEKLGIKGAMTTIDLTPLKEQRGLKNLEIVGHMREIDLRPLKEHRSLTELIIVGKMKKVDLTPLSRCFEIESWIIEGDNCKLQIWPILHPYYLQFDFKRQDIDSLVEFILPQSWKDVWMFLKEIEDSWQIIEACRINHFIEKIFGLEYLGLIDYPLMERYLSLSPELSLEEARKKIVPILVDIVYELVKARHATLGIDLNRIVEHRKFVELVDDIVEYRKQEISSIVIGVCSEVDLMPLWFTAYGFQVLSSLGLGRTAELSELKTIIKAFEGIGIDIKVGDKSKFAERTLTSEARGYIRWLIRRSRTHEI